MRPNARPILIDHHIGGREALQKHFAVGADRQAREAAAIPFGASRAIAHFRWTRHEAVLPLDEAARHQAHVPNGCTRSISGDPLYLRGSIGLCRPIPKGVRPSSKRLLSDNTGITKAVSSKEISVI